MAGVYIGTVDGHAEYPIVIALKNLAAFADGLDTRIAQLVRQNDALVRDLARTQQQLEENIRLAQQLQRQVTEL